jgi:hypothetical protein
MFVYNVTIKVANKISADWLEWLKEEHIPDVMATGCFQEFTLLKLLEVDESEGPTYAVQYKAESKAAYNQYIEKYASALRQKSFDKWGDSFIAFRTIMQIVN